MQHIHAILRAALEQALRWNLAARNVATLVDAPRVRRPEVEHEAGSRWVEGGFVFTTTIGTPLDGSTVTHRFQAAVQAAGLRRLRFHDLRHTCARLLLAQGVHPRVIVEILGHSQIGITMNLYSYVLPAMQKEIANSMEAILAPASQPVADTVADTVAPGVINLPASL